ncbi:MAG: succinate dehydrogenase iron-sulfur subunit [Phycisphaerae bacterium]|nr:succinate dehydrogenase iron-sulfur subunit [Phycisphaerae bacterium]
MSATDSIQPGQPIRLKILRQVCPNSAPYWEEFVVTYQANMNVVSALMEIEAKPVNAEGKETTPVAYDAACLEEVCGSCTMVINGRARQSCSTLIRDLKQPITLQPLRKFPVLRDLVVDRAEMFQRLTQVKAWVPIDGTFALGPGPKMSEKVRALAYEFSRCMTCGCCLDACPQVNKRSSFMGPSAVGQVYLFNSHPTGAELAEDRLDELSKPGGIAECGNAQNCEKACPKKIPLTDALAHLGRRTTVHAIKKLLEQ